MSANKCNILVIDISFGNDRIKGWDVARRARAVNPTLLVIYITGGSGHEWAIQGVPNSVLLTKPFAPARLIAAVSQLLDTTATIWPAETRPGAFATGPGLVANQIVRRRATIKASK